MQYKRSKHLSRLRKRESQVNVSHAASVDHFTSYKSSKQQQAFSPSLLP